LRVITIPSIILAATLFWSCAEEVTPPPSVSHPPEWNQKDALNFHGNKVKVTGNESCKSCHGEKLSGGVSGVSCGSEDCHLNFPHPAGWDNPQDANSHHVYLKNVGWMIEECRSCHGDDYKGGWSLASCYKCHENGPEACNVCHGEGAMPVSVVSSWAPPQDLNDQVATENISVGAHQAHFKDTYTTAYSRDCSLCHKVPQGFDDPDHRNGVVDMQWGDPATNAGEVSPVYANGTCSDVYCHGNFDRGRNPQLIWTEVGTGQSDCGSCHGIPPRRGHIQSDLCYGCHSEVVDAEKNIIGKNKHINGQTDTDFD